MEVEEILDVFDGCLIAQPIKEDYLIVFLGSLPRTVTELLLILTTPPEEFFSRQ